MNPQPQFDPDPILSKLHEVRRELIAEHGGVKGLADFLRSKEQESPDRFLSVAPPRAPKAQEEC